MSTRCHLGRVIASIILTLTLSCTSVPLHEREAIRVPAGLELDVVELAIVLAVVNPPPKTVNFEHKAAQITKEILTAVFGQNRRRVDWFVESREPGLVLAGRQRGEHYLTVAVRYGGESIHIEILGSDNLDQTGDSIHKAAYGWISQLEHRIRIALSDLDTGFGVPRNSPPTTSDAPRST